MNSVLRQVPNQRREHLLLELGNEAIPRVRYHAPDSLSDHVVQSCTLVRHSSVLAPRDAATA